jgi:hypothetical protein
MCVSRRTIGAAALSAVAFLFLPVAGAQAKVKVTILGWTTQAGATSSQVRNGETIKTCLDMGNGQRSLYVVYKGKGIKKQIKVGAGVWGGPPSAGFAAEPTDAEVMKGALKWPVSEKKSFTSRYGFSFAKGPFGPQIIDGVWHAKVVIKQKVVARGTVTVAC